jgi:hypothetical protein
VRDKEVGMDRATIEAAIRICLNEARQRLDEAASVAKAAEACAEAGNVSKGVEVWMDSMRLPS